jgi:hypothetical protein
MNIVVLKLIIVEINFMLGLDLDELFLTRVLSTIPTEIHHRSFNSRSFSSNRNLKVIMNNMSCIEIRG